MKIFNSTVITQLKFVTLFAVSYLDRKGNAKEWQMISRKKQPKCITGETQKPDATIIVPYHRRLDKLAVIKEYRIPVGDYQYGFPAGLVDPGEDMALASGRELFEETGLKLVKIYRHSPAIFSSAGITDESIAMVYVEVDGEPTARHNADSEEIEIFMMDQNEVKDLLNRQDIIFGARAWLALDAYARMGETYLTGD